MTVQPDNLYWDTCNFIRYLSGTGRLSYYDDLVQFVEESQQKNPHWRIYYSTVMLAEFSPNHLADTGFKSIDEFMADLGGAFYPIDPNPNIMILASKLRSIRGVDPSRHEKPSGRALGLGDAIHLATCLFARDTLGIKGIKFQSLDEGKGKNTEGKCYPLIGFERFFPVGMRCEYAELIASLHKEFPEHPSPKLIPHSHTAE